MVGALCFIMLILLLMAFTRIDKVLLSIILVFGLLSRTGIGHSMLGFMFLVGIGKVTFDLFRRR